MISDTLLEELHNLNRADKLRIIQLLAGELAAEDDQALKPGATYEVWSPYDAAGAAETLQKMLDDND